MRLHTFLKRINRNRLTIALFVCLTFVISTYADSVSRLPKTEILGKEYYSYEVKGGESLYGISRKFDWNLQELVRLNPEAQGSIKKGTIIYYPTGFVTVVKEISRPVEIDINTLEPIRHTVKKGETIYGISRQYGVPLETIYRYNPEAAKGVKKGDYIEIPQDGSLPFYYYTIKQDDTLPLIAENFNTSAEEILKNNPGLKQNKLKEGEVIRISLNSNSILMTTALEGEDSMNNYNLSDNGEGSDRSNKQKKESDKEVKDSLWGKEENIDNYKRIEESNNSTFENNQSNYAQPGDPDLYAQESINIYENQEEVETFDDNEIEINIKEEEFASEKIETEQRSRNVRMAVILDDPTIKKDVDFTRGILTALSRFEKSPYKIEMKVLDGRISTSDLSNELDLFEPNLIITTADKAFPAFLADYGNTNNVQIVNAFDLKNDLYEDNPSIIQILPPTSVFSDRVSSEIYKKNNNRKFITIGEKEENDGIVEELINLYNNGEEENLSYEELSVWNPDVFDSLIIYSYAHSKEDVKAFMEVMDTFKGNNPGLDYKVVGRTNWVVLIDFNKGAFSKHNVIIPTRVWLDENSKEWKDFVNRYKNLFGGSPVRSVPNFAATGYDLATYFIPTVSMNQGDFNRDFKVSGLRILQGDINLDRVNNWGGFINNTSYLLEFIPEGGIEKNLIK